eukprot:TRINITY_DN19228_c0_g1_i1.p1 TRINITY_DN19228_c0_g1~~TRINITY_DN19228_c0_g1_i1.p1  ORF type:complete len:321 (-),score=92.89 TRINITY_DN19228_c0_g1_i1:103-1065(-)
MRLAALLALLHLPSALGYARYWGGCSVSGLGTRVMRNEVRPPESSHLGLYVQSATVETAALPGGLEELKTLGKKALEAEFVETKKKRAEAKALREKKKAERAAAGGGSEEESEDDSLVLDELQDDADDLEDDELPEWSKEEIWHRGLGAALQKTTKEVSDTLNFQSSLLLWPILNSDRRFQYVLGVSSGTLEELPVDHPVLSNKTGGILDLALLAEDEKPEADDPANDPGKSFKGLLHIRCARQNVMAVRSKAGAKMPPLLWKPPEGKPVKGVAFAIAYASGRQVRYAELQLGEISKKERRNLVKERLKNVKDDDEEKEL